MIDLNRTKVEMLKEIQASDDVFAHCLLNPTDPAFISRRKVCLRVQGNKASALLPLLNKALSKRFPQIPKKQLSRNLINPIKKGLGNAYKWGNAKDPAKEITVEVVATRIGALIEISDEGSGFDVAGVVDKLEAGSDYFAHGGSGFDRFRKAKSVISYADGGRTLLIRFLCLPKSCLPNGDGKSSALRNACDERLMKPLIEAELPYFREKRAPLESCRIYVPDNRVDDELEIKYVLSYHIGNSSQTKTTTMTGRVLPESDVNAEFHNSEQLYHVPLGKGETAIRIPRPVATFSELPMVLFKFNPSKNLKEYLKKVVDLQTATKTVETIATGLHSLHHSSVALDAEEGLGDAIERSRATEQGIVKKLAQSRPERKARVQKLYKKLAAKAHSIEGRQRVPIHGAFRWKNILHNGEHFYFYHLDRCRKSHPGIDVGSFLADLRRFYLLGKRENPELYDTCHAAFLDAYFGDEQPPWYPALPIFEARAMLMQLTRAVRSPENGNASEIDAELAQIERLMRQEV